MEKQSFVVGRCVYKWNSTLYLPRKDSHVWHTNM